MLSNDSESFHLTIIIVFIIPYLSKDVAAVTDPVNYQKYRQQRSCGITSFRCKSGDCIKEENLCDGTVDCEDGSDETSDCVNIIPCASDLLFQCDYGACINKTKKCDGKFDCKDNSDETVQACAKCGNGKFQCKSGECIGDEDVCDGAGTCMDLSDESPSLCSKFNCPRYSYRCQYGACVKRGARCNGIVECLDESDEQDCDAPIPDAGPFKPTCMKDQFKCTSGQCIDDKKICNGLKDCLDGSDETLHFCSRRRCASTSFTCAYGACVSAAARCNGVIDCLDGSDESGCVYHPPTTKASPLVPTQSSSDSCVMPENLAHAAYQIGKQSVNTHKPGDVVPAFSVLVAKCSDGYSVSPPEESPFSICDNGKWVPTPHKCLRTCPSITSTLNLECKYNNKHLESCNNAVHGTVALTQCEPITEQSGVVKSMVQFCRNGVWNTPISQCTPSAQDNSNSTSINIYYIFQDKRK